MTSSLRRLQERYGLSLNGEIDRALSREGGPLRPFYDMMRYQLGYVDERLEPVRDAAGKRFRPALCLAACEAAGGPWQEALSVAAAIELLHNFSLIHDDIEDRDPTRRHRPTVWKVWGEPRAINAGDAMFALASSAAATCAPNARTCLQVARRFQATTLALTAG